MSNQTSEQINLCNKLLDLERQEDWGGIIDAAGYLSQEIKSEGYFANLLRTAQSWLEITNQVNELKNSENPDDFERVLEIIRNLKQPSLGGDKNIGKQQIESIKELLNTKISSLRIDKWENYPRISEMFTEKQRIQLDLIQRAVTLIQEVTPEQWRTETKITLDLMNEVDLDLDEKEKELFIRLEKLYNEQVEEKNIWGHVLETENKLNVLQTTIEASNNQNKQTRLFTIILLFTALAMIIISLVINSIILSRDIRREKAISLPTPTSITTPIKTTEPSKTPTATRTATAIPTILPTTTGMANEYLILPEERNLPVYENPNEDAKILFLLNPSEFDANGKPIQVMLTQSGNEINEKIPVTFDVIVKKSFVIQKEPLSSTGTFSTSNEQILFFHDLQQESDDLVLWGSTTEDGKLVEFDIKTTQTHNHPDEYLEITLKGWVDTQKLEALP